MQGPKPRLSWIGRHAVIRPRLAPWARSSDAAVSTPPAGPQRSSPPARLGSGAPQARSLKPPQTSNPPGSHSGAPKAPAPPDAELLSARIAIAALESALAQARDENETLRIDRDDALARARAESADAEEATLAIATAIARRVVGRELTVEPSLVVEWVREAMQETKTEPAEIAVAADVAMTVPEAEWDELSNRISMDPHLPRGAIELRAGAHAIGASAEVRLENVTEALAEARRS